MEVALYKFLWTALGLATVLFAQSAAPDRNVDHNIIASTHDPAIRVELPRSAQYVGADRWVLYDIADCELHAWVEPRAANSATPKTIQKLYWVQFEGYIPSKPDLAHTYDSPRHTTIGGLDFYVDTWVRADNAETRQGSDRQHIEALIRSKDFAMPAGMMYVRLVHLLDPQKRKELMYIYGEDLAPTGFTAADLSEKGKSFAQWPAIEKSLIARAEKSITLQSPVKP
jgi:hypothetical protein